MKAKSNAIAKQANRLALKSVLTFQNEWNEKGENVACESGRRDEKNGSEVEGTNSRTLLTMLKC
ncbi:hypothetical protein [Hoylesella nanceiensis]|uniref:hypothetical protein n=1 Tax=Hoylesella nanceiensis TaxID=425941 RepID=UPI0028E6EC55|nr:hypothetical protein [Hoylesella nanceiensis]